MPPPLAQARPNLLNSNFRDSDFDDSSDYRYSTFDIPSNTVAMPNASKSNKAAAGKTGEVISFDPQIVGSKAKGSGQSRRRLERCGPTGKPDAIRWLASHKGQSSRS